jgi:hypothetical protein
VQSRERATPVQVRGRTWPAASGTWCATCDPRQDSRSSLGQRARGHAGQRKADVLAGRAAEKPGYPRVMSMAHLKLRISEKFRKAKSAWHDVPSHHGTEEIPLPPLKKSSLDGMRIRTGHWGSAVYLKRIRKMADDKCWFCQGPARSHVLLHCPNERLRTARVEAWEGKDPGVSGCC